MASAYALSRHPLIDRRLLHLHSHLRRQSRQSSRWSTPSAGCRPRIWPLTPKPRASEDPDRRNERAISWGIRTAATMHCH